MFAASAAAQSIPVSDGKPAGGKPASSRPSNRALFPDDLIDFAPDAGKVVFTAAPGQWDARIRERGWILRDGGVYKLWYTGYDGSSEGIRRLGYATSPDGITWTRAPGNPLVADQWVEDMQVLRHDGRYWMFAEGRRDRAERLVSDDGVSWQLLGTLDVRRVDGQPISNGAFGTPFVWHEEDGWYLLYERSDLGVWLATSTDLRVWTNVQDDPVLIPGPDEYDRDQIAVNQVLRRNGRYFAYFHGCSKMGPHANQWNTGIATSTDRLHWEKYSGNPLFPIELNQSSGILVEGDEGPRLYTMHPEVRLHRPAR